MIKNLNIIYFLLGFSLFSFISSSLEARCGAFLEKAYAKGWLTGEQVRVLTQERKSGEQYLDDAAFSILSSLQKRGDVVHSKVLNDLGLSARWGNEVHHRQQLRAKTDTAVKKQIDRWKLNSPDFMIMETALEEARDSFDGRKLWEVLVGRDRGKAFAAKISKKSLNELFSAYLTLRELVPGQKRYHTIDAMADNLGFSGDKSLFREFMRYLLTEHTRHIRPQDWDPWH